jgi:integrase
MTPGVYLVDPLHVYIKPSIQTRGTGKAKRHLVKWKVAGAEKTRSYDKLPDARAFKTDLEAAKSGRRQERFDRISGLPESMLVADTGDTFLDYARRILANEWSEWSPGNRRARTEGLAELAAVFVMPGRGKPDRLVLRRWARDIALEQDPTKAKSAAQGLRLDGKKVTAAELARVGEWLDKHSRPVTDLDSLVVVEDLLKATSMSPAGKQYSPDTRQRIRTALSLVCLEGVRLKVLQTNQVTVARVKIQGVSDKVDPSEVPTAEQARQMVDALSTISKQAVSQYRAYFTMLWLSGCRPSEASGLHNDKDLVLPEAGWGRAELKSPTVHPGSRWTDSGEAFDDRDKLKARQKEETRPVLLPPELVAELRRHIKENKVARGARVFTNSNGQPIDPSAMSGVWRKVRSRAFPDGEFETLRPYDLRHTAASLMLQATGPNGERISVQRTAAQLGNSAATLMRVYARIISSDDDSFMAAMDAALATD